MFTFGLVMFAVGLVVGWNVLPQPAWAANMWSWVVSKFTAE